MEKRKSSKGLIWSFFDSFLQQLVNFSIGIILARLLSPKEFGVVGIIAVFIALSNVIVNAGFSEAIINRKKVSEEEYSSVFWLNLMISGVVYFILFITAPLVESFFEIVNLSELIRVTGLSVIFMSLSIIQRTMLTRDLDFKRIAIISFISVILSGGVAIYMAFNGYGIYSLVIRMTLGQFLTMIFFYSFNRWKPLLLIKWSFINSIFDYSYKLFLSKLLNAIYNNVYYVIIGKVFSTDILGYYTRAENFKNVASINIANTINRVSFPVLSKIEVKEELRRKFILYFTITSLLSGYAMNILFINADNIILILVGEEWNISINYLRVLSISGLFIPIYMQNLSIQSVIGNATEYLRIEFYNKLLIIPGVFLAIYLGIDFLLQYIVSMSVVLYLFSVYKLRKVFNNLLQEQMKLLFPIGCMSFILIIMTSFISDFIDNEYFELLCQVAIISISFLFLIKYFYKNLNILNLEKIWRKK